MKLVNMDRPVTSEWLRKEGRRFDAGPFLSDAVEGRILLESLDVPKDPLHALTKGHSGGIYMSGRGKRVYVTDPKHGTRYLTTSNMLQADLSTMPLLANRLVEQDPPLKVTEGMTLITRSGTIGRMTYCRPDMDAMACCEDVLRVVPDPDKIPPGYLYAFLSSKYGVPLVTSGTYGAVIQHIEPEHLADLPVPRLSPACEEEISSLVVASARKMTAYGRGLRAATDRLMCQLKIDTPNAGEWFGEEEHLGWTEPVLSPTTFRAYNYDPRVAALEELIRHSRTDPLGDLCEPSMFRGRITFKRIPSEPAYGRLLVGQRDAFRIRPDGQHISEASVQRNNLLVPQGSTLIPSHGTLGERELYCRAVLTTKRTSDYAFSGDFHRCVPLPGAVPNGYLFAFLRSEVAFRMLRGMSTGGKQQLHHPELIYRMPVPRLSVDVECEIDRMVEEAAEAFDESLDLEDRAWEAIEDAFAKVARGALFGTDR